VSSVPGDRTLPPGEVLHVGFGVRYRVDATVREEIIEWGYLGLEEMLLGAQVEGPPLHIQGLRAPLAVAVEGLVAQKAERTDVVRVDDQRLRCSPAHTVCRGSPSKTASQGRTVRTQPRPGPLSKGICGRGASGVTVTQEETGSSGADGQWLVALCGLPGVGKSTVAEYLTERLDAVRLRTDAVRKELFAEPQYTEEETETVYRELCERAGRHLEGGESVVLDATFADGAQRVRARDLASRHGVGFRLVEVVCDQSVAERRIATRDGISDADVSIYQELKEQFDPIDCEHPVIDNSGSKPETYEQIDRLF